ncbi:unnamed protein product [Euphydryas editha]|uniref:Endonuclease/exonuclease/phosphatase domain-containing protein n=1 Tax=Euphydryas editha TaxID=104508 RepID=A0AAU9US07_EUPED|nr:unnamed protein product [Euphydryas editha]
MPVFVAYDLHKLPPICFDHVDVTKILKDLLILQAEVKQIKSNYVTTDLLEEMKQNLQAFKEPLLFFNDNNINTRRGGYIRDSGPLGLPHVTSELTADADVTAHAKGNDSAAVKNAHNNVANNEAINTPTYRSLFRSQINNIIHDTDVPAAVHVENTTLKKDLRIENSCNDGWTLVQRRKSLNRFTGKTGKAVASPTGKFKAAEMKIPLLISNVNKQTTEHDICEYIKSKTQEHVDLEKIIMKREKPYNAFKLFVSKNKLNIYLNDNLWPEECVRRLCKTSDVIALQETWLWPHELPYLGSLDDNFAYTDKSSMDTTVGVIKGRPFGGVALLWRKGAFQSVSLVSCDSDRLVAIKIVHDNRTLLLFSVYMPFDNNQSENLIEFSQCLSEISAIIESENVASVIMVGDFNAHPGERFSRELLSTCTNNPGIVWTLNFYLVIHTLSFVRLVDLSGG